MEKSCDKRKILEQNDEARVLTTDASESESLSKKRKLRNHSSLPLINTNCLTSTDGETELHSKNDKQLTKQSGCADTSTFPVSTLPLPLVSIKAGLLIPPKPCTKLKPSSTTPTTLSKSIMTSKHLSTKLATATLPKSSKHSSTTPPMLTKSLVTSKYSSTTPKTHLQLSTKLSSLPTKPKTDCANCKENTTALNNMYGLMLEMSQTLKRNTIILQKISNGNNSSTIHSYEDSEHLPLASLKDMVGFNEMLKKQETLNKMVSYLSVFGGKDVSSTIRTVLSKVITNKLATQLNWIEGEKQSIGKFEQILLMIALKVNYPGVQGTEVNAVIKPWLRNAGDRDGGRGRRRKKVVLESSDNSEEDETELHGNEEDQTLIQAQKGNICDTVEQLPVSDDEGLACLIQPNTGNSIQTEAVRPDTDNIPVTLTSALRHDWRLDIDSTHSDNDFLELYEYE